MLRTALAFTLALLVFPACGKKDKDEGGAGKAGGGGGAAAADKPHEMEAKALFADYNRPNQDGLELMKKWRPGVLVTGVVTNVMEGLSTVYVDPGAEGKRLSLGFTDEGKAATAKGVKAGDTIKAQCKIGGSDGNLMMLTDCELK